MPPRFGWGNRQGGNRGLGGLPAMPLTLVTSAGEEFMANQRRLADNANRYEAGYTPKRAAAKVRRCYRASHSAAVVDVT